MELTGTKPTKTCRLCNVEKSLDEYYKHPNTRDLLRHDCKDCINSVTGQYYIDNKARMVLCRKDYHFRRNYGLSLDEVLQRKKDQEDRCPLCSVITDLVVDHDHKTGIVRGLICAACNHGLGNFRDSPEALRKAAYYLEEQRS